MIDEHCRDFILKEHIKRFRDNIKAALMPEKEDKENPIFLSTSMLDKDLKLTKVGRYKPYPEKKKQRSDPVKVMPEPETGQEPKKKTLKERIRKESKRDKLQREIEELKAKLNKSERF